MSPHSALLSQLFRLTSPSNDAELLRRWVQRRDEDAFAALVNRHGRMVLGTCRRVLGNTHDAEDVFQAVFLILARKSGSLRHPEALPGWLHGVAVRLAYKARTGAARRRSVAIDSPDAEPRDPHPDPLDALSARDLMGLIDREIARLPEVYRLPLVLCDLEERTQPEAARLLGWKLGSVRNRLLRARKRLRARLARRGIAPAVLVVASKPGLVEEAALMDGVRRLAMHYSSCPASVEVPASVAALVRAGMRDLMLTKLKLMSAVLVVASTLVAGAGLLAWPNAAPQPPVEERADNKPPTTTPDAKTESRRDQAGDPLPDEALARLGTLRFRHGGTILSLAFTPDAKSLVSQGEDGIRIWDTATGKQIRQVGPGSAGTGRNAVSPDGKFVAVLLPEREGNVGLLEVATGRIVQRVSKRQVRSLCFSPDGKTVATLGHHSEIDLWDPATGKALGTLKGHQDLIWSVAFAADGKMLVSAGDDRTIRFWDVASGKQQRQIETENRIGTIVLSPDGRLLASISHIKHEHQNMAWWLSEPVIRLWETQTGKELRQLTMPAVEVRPGMTVGFSTLLFSQDGKTLITGCQDGVVRIWDPMTGKKVRKISGFTGGPFASALHPDGKTLAVVDGNSTIRLIRLDTGEEHPAFVGHRAGVGFVHLRPNNGVAVTSSWDGLLHFWDTRTGKIQQKRMGKSGSVLQILPDGKTCLTEGDDKKLHVCDLDTGKEVRIVQGWNGRPFLGNLSPDGHIFAQFDPEDTKVDLINPATGKRLHTLTGFEQSIMGMSFTQDGRTLFLWSADKTVTVWDPATGKKQRQFSGPADPNPGLMPGGGSSYLPFTAALSPDGKLLAFGFQNTRISAPGILPVADTTTGKEVHRFSTATDGVSRLVFSPDGKSLAWGGWRDGTVYVGEIATGRQRHNFVGHTGRILSLAFSADGKMLLSGSWDTTALVWDLTGILTMAPKFGGALSAEELETHWKTLVAEDAAASFQAMQTLAADPTRSVPYLRERLHAVAQADEKSLQRWIADLDSDQFKIREKATAELEKLGPAALHAMRKAIDEKPRLETRRRLGQLIEKQEREEWPTSGEKLRIWRALEVLERAGTPEAKAVLTILANGAPGARQTVDAGAALQRLAQRQGL
jgi:RNA polymerase sigma factor (sigma-70 family)